MMYFSDNKLISKARYQAARSRSQSKPKRSTRSTKSKGARKMAKRTMPHPSVTGMASGLAIASYLNAGKSVTTRSGYQTTTSMTDGVLKDITDGELGQAANTLASNSINLITSDAGRKTLVTAGVVAAAGAFARRQFPMLKLGGSKLYFRL